MAKIAASLGLSPPYPLSLSFFFSLSSTLYLSLSPAVHPVLSSSQQFVYGTLFAKLIFPPFK